MQCWKMAIAAVATMGWAAFAPAVGAQVREHEIRVGIGLPAEHPQGLSVKKFGDVVSELSGGKIRLTLHAGGKLGNDVTMIEQMVAGTLEMAVPDTATLVKKVGGFGVLNFPFLFRDEREADALVDGPFGQKLLAELGPHGLIGLVFWENGFRNVTNNVRPIRRVEDFKNVRFRVMQNPMFVETFQHLGSSAVPMPFPEVYGALKAGKVDGQENPIATIYSSRFYDVQKYLSLTQHTYSVFVLMMSKKVWDRLTPEEQKIFRTAAVESRAFERATLRAYNAKILEDLRATGMQINELPVWEWKRLQHETRSVLNKYKKEFGREWAADMYINLMENELAKTQPTKP